MEPSKCINSLDNPLSGGAPVPIQLATDLHAAAEEYEEFPAELPVRIMNWGLLAKSNAVHGPHMDRVGTCTFVAVEDGSKKWDIGFAANDVAEEEAASPFAYGSDMMTSQRNFSRGWRWTSILLDPGSLLCVL